MLYLSIKKYFKVRKTIHCVDVRWKECTYVSAPLAVVLTLILCFEALLFLLFTAIMFCTQIHAISVDETGIEQLKGEKNLGNKSKWANFKQVFGYQPTWTWFLSRIFNLLQLKFSDYLIGISEDNKKVKFSSFLKV